MRRRLGLTAALLALALGATSCLWSKPVQRRYYTLVQPRGAQAAKKAFPADLWVREVEIASVYDRPQIVFRHSPTELRYFHLESWADRPQRMMSQHLVQALRGSGLFRSVVERLGTSPPDYVLESTVLAIEQLDGGDVWYAHLAMSFRLSRFGKNAVVWQYDFDERRPVADPDVALTVRALSEILDAQMDRVRAGIDARLAGRPDPNAAKTAKASPASGTEAAPAPAPWPAGTQPVALSPDAAPPDAPETGSAPPDAPAGEEGAGATAKRGHDRRSRRALARAAVLAAEDRIDWRKSAQYATDPTVVPPGKGAVFLPALSGDPEREPTVEVYAHGENVASGLMGRRIPVAPGHYRVFFGSGTLSQRMARQVDVTEGEVVVVDPDWSALDISVVDEKFIPWRGTYEIHDRIRAEYVGLGYGADEEQGERTQVWVLPPGLYKIVQSGANYRARTNFATVQLPKGDFVPFVLVMDPATSDFLGAGVSDAEEGGKIFEDERWSLRWSLGGDMMWSSRSGQDTEVGSEFALTVFSDNLARFRDGPHLWTTRLEIEEGQRLLARVRPDGSHESLADAQFEPITDRLYLNSLYIYELLSWAGPYLRLGGETSAFNRYRYPADGQSVIVRDPEGAVISERSDQEQVLLAHSFSPLEFKQGAGVNFRVWHTTMVDLDLRTGLGARQYLAFGQLLSNDELTTGTQLVLDQATNSFLLGPEATVVASVRLTRYLQATTELDALVPFGGTESTRFTWRNAISLRLSNFASLVYTLNLDRNPNVGRENPLAIDQGLRLRFSWIVF